jgi:hypothetical protein
MGGSVAIERAEMNGGQRDSLFTKEAKPAVSCPTDGSTKLTAFESMMCSEGAKLSSNFPKLGDLTNDEELINGRHSGASPGPHRVATEGEVATCERVARAIIDSYAAKIVV